MKFNLYKNGGFVAQGTLEQLTEGALEGWSASAQNILKDYWKVVLTDNSKWTLELV